MSDKLEENTEKKKSKKAIIISLVIILLLLVVIVGGYFAYKYINKNKTTGTTWGDTYYAYLEEAIENKDLAEAEKYGLQVDMQNTNIQFCELEENANPVMVMSYSKDNKEYANAYHITDDEKVINVEYKEPSKVEFLYNIELKQYIWYIHIEKGNEDLYKPLNTAITEINTNKNENNLKTEETKTANLKSDITIPKDSETEVKTLTGETITLTKYDETFIIPEIEQNKKIDINLNNISKNELKKAVTQTVKEYKKNEEIITDNVKTEVEEKVTALETKKKSIETAKAEIKAEEERIVAEKAAEEAKKGLKVGNITVKYGKYKDPEFGTIFVLNPDGTCIYDGKNYTYKVERHDFSQDINPHYKTGIVFYQPNGQVYFAFYPHNSTTLYSCGVESLNYIGD